MEELVKLMSRKTGLSEEMAETGVEMITGFLKGKLPTSLTGEVDSILGSAVSTPKKEAKTTKELVKQVSQKTGLSEEMAETALELVLGYLKDNLPDPVAGVIDMLVSGTGNVESGVGIDELLSGILGQ